MEAAFVFDAGHRVDLLCVLGVLKGVGYCGEL